MAIIDLLASSAHKIPLGALFAIKGGFHFPAILTGGVTLNDTFPMWCAFDPNNGGGRTIVLDGTATVGEASLHGLWRIITNKADAAENLVIDDADGNTIATVNQNETGVFYQDEDDGWVLVIMFTTTLT